VSGGGGQTIIEIRDEQIEVVNHILQVEREVENTFSKKEFDSMIADGADALRATGADAFEIFNEAELDKILTELLIELRNPVLDFPEIDTGKLIAELQNPVFEILLDFDDEKIERLLQDLAYGLNELNEMMKLPNITFPTPAKAVFI